MAKAAPANVGGDREEAREDARPGYDPEEGGSRLLSEVLSGECFDFAASASTLRGDQSRSIIPP